VNFAQAYRQQWLRLLLAATIAWAGQSHAQSDDGEITINSASIAFDGLVASLDIDADIALPREIRAGLNSGVPLEFIVQMRFSKPRGWLPAATLAKFERRYSLIYYELTRHYRVRALDTDISRNFRSLFPALEELGDLRDVMLTLTPEQSRKLEEAQHASVQIKLNSAALPLPLQPVFTSTWRLSSKDYSWPLR